MSFKLRDRRKGIPNGFMYRQALTGWESWKIDENTKWDFFLLCRKLQEHRLSNPKYKLSTSMAAIESEVDASNAARVAAMPNSESYVVSTDTAPSFQSPPQTTLLRRAVGAVNKIAAGAETISDFIDSGESPVAQELAESRAAVCVKCPLNEKGDLSRFFTIPAAERIRKQIEVKEGRGLKTSVDEKLNICGACLCTLKLKVWFPLPFIVKHMSEDVKVQLDVGCWILKGGKNA